jgi:hypothetical protein
MANRFQVKLNQKFDQVAKAYDRGSQNALLGAVTEWHRGVVKILRGPRTGKVYEIPGTNREYTASAPGEAPATRLGDLRTSYRFILKKNEALIGSPLHYALDLEKGTYRIKPRPHLTKAFVKNRKAILSHLEGPWL